MPSRTPFLAPAILDAAGKKLREKQFEERVKENPYDPQVTAEVGKSIGDAVTAIKELTGQPAKQRDQMVADDFCRAVAEVEKSASTLVPDHPKPTGGVAPTLPSHAP